MEFNLKRDIDKTIDMIERRKEEKEIEDPSFQQVFAHSTVNHKELYKRINGSFEKFLGLTGSTSPMLNAVCMGAKEVTSFDISVPAGYHNYFKIAAILGLEYEEFLRFYYDVKGKKAFDFDIYQNIRGNLPSNDMLDAKKYFDILYDYVGQEDIRRYFFKDIDCIDIDMKNTSMLEGAKNLFITKTHFEELKRRLKTVAFRYYIADMHDIPEMLKNERFNVIYLGAAHEFIYPSADALDILFYLDLLNEFKPLLKQGGTMQAAYFYSPLFEMNKDYYTFRSMMIEANGYKREDLKLDMYLGDHTLVDRAYVYRK